MDNLHMCKQIFQIARFESVNLHKFKMAANFTNFDLDMVIIIIPVQENILDTFKWVDCIYMSG